MEATAEIPDFKLAKVGKNREKKKGGVPLWLRGAKGGNSFLGALGGEGISGGGLLTQLLPKFIMASMIASMGVGAYGLKMALGPQKAFQPAAAKPKKLFDSAPTGSQKYSGDLSNLPGGGGSSQSGLSMIKGGVDDAGAAAAQAAKEAADAAAAKDKAAQDAAAQNGKDGQAAPGTPDPNAAAAAMAAAAAGAGGNGAGKSSPFGSRFGSLSSGFGGGSSPFQSGGMFGGVGHSFDNGKLSGFGNQAQAGRAQASASPTARNPASRLAARQLNSAFGLSRVGAGNSTNDGASYNASRAFDNNPGQIAAQTQGPIGGATTPTGGAGAGADPSGSGGGGGGGYSSNSPSLGGPPQNPMDNCVQLLGPDYSNSANGGCVQTTAGTDVTPWGGLARMASMLLLLGAVLLLIASILSYIVKAGGWQFQHLVMILAAAGAALGATAAAMGMAIMAQGQILQGMMFTIPGAMIAASGVMVALAGHGGEAHTWIMSSWHMGFTMISGLMGMGAGAMGAMHPTTAASNMQ